MEHHNSHNNGKPSVNGFIMLKIGLLEAHIRELKKELRVAKINADYYKCRYEEKKQFYSPSLFEPFKGIALFSKN